MKTDAEIAFEEWFGDEAEYASQSDWKAARIAFLGGYNAGIEAGFDVEGLGNLTRFSGTL